VPFVSNSLNIIRVVDSVIQVVDKSSSEKNSIFWRLEELGGWGKGNAVSRLNQASKQDLEGNSSFKVLSLTGRFIFLVNVSVFSNKGSEGLPRQVFRGLIDTLDNRLCSPEG
jgi:hypothetical protein